MYPKRSHAPGQADEFFITVRRQLGRAVATVCPSWLADQREDIVQVAMMRILRATSRSEGTREFASYYLWRVAYCALIDEIRRVRRRSEQGLDAEGLSGDPAWDAPNPEKVVEGREVGEAIVACLGRLVRTRRLAVTLSLQGHTVPEIAVLLGYGRKKAENLVYRGLVDLRRCLASKGVKP